MLKDPSTLGNPYNFVGSNPGGLYEHERSEMVEYPWVVRSIFLFLWSVFLNRDRFFIAWIRKKLTMSKSVGIVCFGLSIFLPCLGTTVAWVFLLIHSLGEFFRLK